MAQDRRSVRVLLVEDTPDDERLALRALSRSSFEVTSCVARDGVEALDQLLDSTGSDSRVLPHLVLLDLKLPKLSGLEVLRAIRANSRTSHLPVVILTSSDEQRDLVECYQSHCNAYVRKAVDYEEYMDAMRRLLEFWLPVNRVPALIGLIGEPASYAV